MSATKATNEEISEIAEIKYESKFLKNLYHYIEVNLYDYKKFSDKIQNSIDTHIRNNLFCYEKILYPELLTDLILL